MNHGRNWDSRKSVSRLILFIFSYSVVFSGFFFSRVSASDREDTVVRVGYYENELFQEGAREGAVKTGYAYEYYRKISEYTGWRYEYVYGGFGDLYQMLYPTGKGRETELVYGPGFTYTTASDPRGGNAITIRTSSESGSGRLYCRRDSFGIALYPYLAEAFESAEFSRSSDWSVESFTGLGADTVILEIVERNIPTLLPAEEATA